MEKALDDILGIQGVWEVLLTSREGKVLFRVGKGPGTGTGASFPDDSLDIRGFEGLAEADLFFEDARLYVRLAPSGFLMVLMDPGASAAMVRLNCDSLAATLENGKNGRKKSRLFFKRNR